MGKSKRKKMTSSDCGGSKERWVDGRCEQCPTCAAGQGLQELCGYGNGAGVTCQPCPDNTFHPDVDNNGDNRCQPCLNCTRYRRHFRYKCRDVANAVCAECWDGYFDGHTDESGRWPCEPCSAAKPNNSACIAWQDEMNTADTTTFATGNLAQSGGHQHAFVAAVILGPGCLLLLAVVLVLLWHYCRLRKSLRCNRSGQMAEDGEEVEEKLNPGTMTAPARSWWCCRRRSQQRPCLSSEHNQHLLSVDNVDETRTKTAPCEAAPQPQRSSEGHRHHTGPQELDRASLENKEGGISEGTSGPDVASTSMAMPPSAHPGEQLQALGPIHRVPPAPNSNECLATQSQLRPPAVVEQIPTKAAPPSPTELHVGQATRVTPCSSRDGATQRQELPPVETRLRVKRNMDEDEEEGEEEEDQDEDEGRGRGEDLIQAPTPSMDDLPSFPSVNNNPDEDEPSSLASRISQASTVPIGELDDDNLPDDTPALLLSDVTSSSTVPSIINNPPTQITDPLTSNNTITPVTNPGELQTARNPSAENASDASDCPRQPYQLHEGPANIPERMAEIQPNPGPGPVDPEVRAEAAGSPPRGEPHGIISIKMNITGAQNQIFTNIAGEQTVSLPLIPTTRALNNNNNNEPSSRPVSMAGSLTYPEQETMVKSLLTMPPNTCRQEMSQTATVMPIQESATVKSA